MLSDPATGLSFIVAFGQESQAHWPGAHGQFDVLPLQSQIVLLSDPLAGRRDMVFFGQELHSHLPAEQAPENESVLLFLQFSGLDVRD